MTIDTPENISLLDEFKFLVTGERYSSLGAKYIGELFPSYPAEGETLQFSWGTNIIDFVFKNVPNGTDNQLPVYSSGPYSSYIFSLSIYLNANYYISRDFVITTTIDKIIFTARNEGTDFTISKTTDVTGLTLIETQTASDKIIKPFYKLGMSIINTDREILGEDLFGVDENNQVLFNLSEYVKHELVSTFIRENDFVNFINQKNHLKRYDLRYYEYYGNNPERKLMQGVNNFYLINGNLDKFNFALNTQNGTNFKEYQLTKKRFLTNQPRIKKVNYSQQERLYFLNITASTIKLKAVFYFSDDTDSSDYIVETAISYPNNIFEFITTPEKLIYLYRVEMGVLKEVNSIKVWLTDDNDISISEEMIYNIDYNFVEKERFYIFKNSLGEWDTLRTTGVNKKESKYKNTEFTNYFTETETKQFEVNKKRSIEKELYKTNTGWLKDRLTVNYLRELFLSDYVFEIIGTEYLPIVIESKSAKIFTDDNYNYNVEFAYRRTNDNKYYSNIFEKDILGGTIFNPNDFDPNDFFTEAYER